MATYYVKSPNEGLKISPDDCNCVRLSFSNLGANNTLYLTIGTYTGTTQKLYLWDASVQDWKHLVTLNGNDSYGIDLSELSPYVTDQAATLYFRGENLYTDNPYGDNYTRVYKGLSFSIFNASYIPGESESHAKLPDIEITGDVTYLYKHDGVVYENEAYDFNDLFNIMYGIDIDSALFNFYNTNKFSGMHNYDDSSGIMTEDRTLGIISGNNYLSDAMLWGFDDTDVTEYLLTGFEGYNLHGLSGCTATFNITEDGQVINLKDYFNRPNISNYLAHINDLTFNITSDDPNYTYTLCMDEMFSNCKKLSLLYSISINSYTDKYNSTFVNMFKGATITLDDNSVDDFNTFVDTFATAYGHNSDGEYFPEYAEGMFRDVDFVFYTSSIKGLHILNIPSMYEGATFKLALDNTEYTKSTSAMDSFPYTLLPIRKDDKYLSGDPTSVSPFYRSFANTTMHKSSISEYYDYMVTHFMLDLTQLGVDIFPHLDDDPHLHYLLEETFTGSTLLFRLEGGEVIKINYNSNYRYILQLGSNGVLKSTFEGANIDTSEDASASMFVSKLLYTFGYLGAIESAFETNRSDNLVYLGEHYFDSTFKNCTGIGDLSLVSCILHRPYRALEDNQFNSALLQPLPDYLCANMFEGSDVKYPPKYLGDYIYTLGKHCFDSMFKDCKNLVRNVPLGEINLTNDNNYYLLTDPDKGGIVAPTSTRTLNDYCFHSMYEGCTNLIYAEFDYYTNPLSLPTDQAKKALTYQYDLTNSQIAKTFKGANVDPSVVHVEGGMTYHHAFDSMYKGCRNLRAFKMNSPVNCAMFKPETPSEYVYYRMFEGCTSIGWDLPVPVDSSFDSKLKSLCYDSNYSNYKLLVTSMPYLYCMNLDFLGTGAYVEMFKDCVNLRVVPTDVHNYDGTYTTLKYLGFTFEADSHNSDNGNPYTAAIIDYIGTHLGYDFYYYHDQSIQVDTYKSKNAAKCRNMFKNTFSNYTLGHLTAQGSNYKHPMFLPMNVHYLTDNGDGTYTVTYPGM